MFGKVVEFAFDDFTEAANGVFEFDVLAFEAGELRGDEKGLRQETLDAAGARNNQFVVFRELIKTENCDYVLLVSVALQRLLNRLRCVVVFFADNARIEQART